jgi:hypothetical protein
MFTNLILHPASLAAVSGTEVATCIWSLKLILHT